MISIKEILEYLAKKLDHEPTAEEITENFKGVGLLILAEEIKKEREKEAA